MKKKYSKILTLFALFLFTQIIIGQNNISAFGPDLSFVNVGQTNVPTSPEPLTLELDSPAIGNVTITITSDNPSALSVNDITIPDGQSSAVVLVSGLSQSNSVTVNAILNAQTLQANVRVVGSSEVPQLAELNASEDTILPGGSTTISAVLDIPAKVGGSTINLSLSPVTAGTIPSSIIIPEGQIQGDFDYSDGNNTSNCMITATLEGASLTTNITMDPSLSTENTDNPLAFSVFPNPFANQLTFTLPSNQKSTVRIYNMLSQLVIEQKLSNSLTIETNDLKDGVYMYTIKNNQGKVLKSGKLIKK